MNLVQEELQEAVDQTLIQPYLPQYRPPFVMSEVAMLGINIFATNILEVMQERRRMISEILSERIYSDPDHLLFLDIELSHLNIAIKAIYDYNGKEPD